MRFLVATMMAILVLVTEANAQGLARSYLSRSNLQAAQSRYNATHNRGVPSYSRNYAKHVPRQDYYLAPSQRMQLDRQIQNRQWHNQMFPNSGFQHQNDSQNMPIYGPTGQYIGSVTSDRDGSQLYRNNKGQIESRSQVTRGHNRLYYGPNGEFQGRTNELDNTSAMERFLTGVNE